MEKFRDAGFFSSRQKVRNIFRSKGSTFEKRRNKSTSLGALSIVLKKSAGQMPGAG
jgi:hypothetical protein